MAFQRREIGGEQDMKNDCKGCFGAGSSDCDQCEDLKAECRKEIFVTDLKSHFTGNMKDGVLTGAWIVEDEEKKELILKFNERISRAEKIVCLQLIGQSLIEQAAKEDESGEEDYSFRDLLDGIRIREWNETDKEQIRHGISKKGRHTDAE